MFLFFVGLTRAGALSSFEKRIIKLDFPLPFLPTTNIWKTLPENPNELRLLPRDRSEIRGTGLVLSSSDLSIPRSRFNWGAFAINSGLRSDDIVCGPSPSIDARSRSGRARFSSGVSPLIFLLLFLLISEWLRSVFQSSETKLGTFERLFAYSSEIALGGLESDKKLAGFECIALGGLESEKKLGGFDFCFD